MNNLKHETLTKCFSLLREFIDETPGANSKKGVAILALNQLKRITAGTDGSSSESGGPNCTSKPRADR